MPWVCRGSGLAGKGESLSPLSCPCLETIVDERLGDALRGIETPGEESALKALSAITGVKLCNMDNADALDVVKEA